MAQISPLTFALVFLLSAPWQPVAAPPGYASAVAALPPSHWMLVTRADAILPPDHGHTYGDRRIEVPKRADGRILIHEVGHVVALAHPELEAAYLARFRPRGDPHEAFAEAYRAAVEGHGSDWMRQTVLIPLAPPVSSSAPSRPAVPILAPCPGGELLPSGSIVPGCTREG